MGPVEQIIQILNFIAPAWGVAIFCALVVRFMPTFRLPLTSWSLLKQTVVSGCLGSGVLFGGLVLWGVDGKMTTYLVLVIVCGTVQWWMCKGWQR